MAYLRTMKLNDFTDEEKHAEVYAELVQLLDDKSLTLIIREAKDDGPKALTILREYYIGSSKPRIIALYSELTSLKMTNEDVTDYLLRGETAAALLRNAGEVVSDSLLICMLLKGLPDDYKAFSTIIIQKGEMEFSNFKVALRNYEETEKCRDNRPEKFVSLYVRISSWFTTQLKING